MIKVGNKVWIKILNKYKFRGTVVEIKDNIATIHVPTHYGNQNYVVFEKDVNFLVRVPETLKELENQKEAKRNGSN